MARKPDLQKFKELMTGDPPELGPGSRKEIQPVALLTAALDALLDESTLPVISRELVRGLILLWHDHLDPAHAIAQSIENPDGSYLHGIIHRREQDFSNANYWFRRVGGHVCFPIIATRTKELLKSHNELSARLIQHDQWEPFVFIQLCEKLADQKSSQPQVQLLQQIQAIEFDVLLGHFLECSI